MNEENLIGRVIETAPEYVDRIVVVDYASKDGTIGVVNSYLPQMNECLRLIRRGANRGMGCAIASGYNVRGATR